MSKRAILGVLCAALVVATAQGADVSVPQRDWKGSQDHPIISRFNGSVITAYQQVEYEELAIPLGKFKNSKDSFDGTYEKGKFVEGKLTRIAYAVAPGKSTLEVFRNYQQAMTGAGFQPLFVCNAEECGGWRFPNALYREVINRKVGDDRVLINSTNSDDVRHMSAMLRRPSGDVYATVTVTRKDNGIVSAYLRTVETQPMATDQVQVFAATAIASAIAAEGKVALYGILFDTDSAVVRDDSKPTLDEMAKFLKSQPNTKVFIVGHTDNTGTLAHNTELSQKRADAVVKSLTGTYAIPASQLSSKGLASYAPIASNDEEPGRAKNRRVEIVKQ